MACMPTKCWGTKLHYRSSKDVIYLHRAETDGEGERGDAFKIPPALGSVEVNYTHSEFQGVMILDLRWEFGNAR